MKDLPFFRHLREKKILDYTIIVDGSFSMNFYPHKDGKYSKKRKKWLGLPGKNERSRWDQAREAALLLVEPVTTLDPDGLDLYIFSSKEPIYYPNVSNPVFIRDIFNHKVQPYGGTDLHGVLKVAIERRRPKETILVITDGKPDKHDNIEKVKRLLVETTKQLKSPDELSISFIQIGQDKEAQQFLQTLDDDLEALGARFDIVECLTYEDLHLIDFSNFIKLVLESQPCTRCVTHERTIKLLQARLIEAEHRIQQLNAQNQYFREQQAKGQSYSDSLSALQSEIQQCLSMANEVHTTLY